MTYIIPLEARLAHYKIALDKLKNYPIDQHTGLCLVLGSLFLRSYPEVWSMRPRLNIFFIFYGSFWWRSVGRKGRGKRIKLIKKAIQIVENKIKNSEN